MNTTHPVEIGHPPQSLSLAEAIASASRPAPRTSLADRVAMRIGLRLLLWSARHTVAAETARRENDLSRIAREARAEHESAIARAQLHGAQQGLIR